MLITRVLHVMSCCCYHKGTYFQANHNFLEKKDKKGKSCCCYHKGTYFQANHNEPLRSPKKVFVVVATTKVRIFKQITTIVINDVHSF